MNKSECLLFHGGSPIGIIWGTNQSQEVFPRIQRMCCLKSHWLLVLTQNKDLYEGHLDDKNCSILLNFVQTDIEDLQFCTNLSRLYMITIRGEAYFQNIVTNATQLNKQWERIIFDPLELYETEIMIQRLSCSAYGVIFISQSGDVYALGDCGDQHSIDYEQPKLLRLFKCSTNIIDVTAGDDFFVFLTQNNVSHSITCTAERQKVESRKETCSSRSPSLWSISCTSDQKEIQHLVDLGATLLHTAVYTLGSSNEGRLGTGDYIKRDTIFRIDKLNNLGIYEISAGRDHAIALSLDGRLFQWGLNDRRQLIDCSDNVLSSPMELCEASKTNIYAACCGDYKTILLNYKSELYENERLTYTQDTVNNYTDLLLTDKCPCVLSAGQFTIYNIQSFKSKFQPAYNHLQQQIRTLINLYKGFQHLNKMMHKICKELQSVSYHLQTTLYLLLAILDNFEKFYCGYFENPFELIFVKAGIGCIEMFETYTKTYCDTYSVDGFQEAAETLTPTAIPGQDSKYQDLLKMFQQPFQIFPYIKQILGQLHEIDVADTLAWENFLRQSRIELELAENTRDFWNNNARNLKIHQFKRKDRRVILTSVVVPLKQSHPISLTTPMVILFSDCLCQVYNHVNIFPLVAVWLKREENGIRIITPEKNFLLAARNKHDENLWYDQLESSIRVALNLNENVKLPEVRCIQYSFTAHSSRGVNMKGSFSNGVMHGKCHLEYPDGKIYAGEISHGEIEGYGHMFVPKVGFYFGQFRMGKFWGYGTLEMNENDMYEGHFRNGLFHGHGYLHQNDCVYIGEFQDNQKSGYGVLDDAISGHKYMGIFMDNKRAGHGACVTSTGDYFEGIFANDELTGKGVALLQNHCYYEGELTLHGPNGTGKYYMPTSSTFQHEASSVSGTSIETDNNQVNGTILSGHLTGYWNKVSIKLGTMKVNQAFAKYPSSLNAHGIGNEKKWATLFENFESDLFGDLMKTTLSQQMLTYALWNRVLSYILRQQELSNNQFLSGELDIQNKLYQASGKRLQYAENTSMNAEKLSLSDTTGQLELDRLSHSQVSLNGSNTNVNIDLMHVMSKTESFTMTGYKTDWSANKHYDTANGGDSFYTENSVYLEGKMNVIPQFGLTELNIEEFQAIKEYLANAFTYRYHPFYHLNQRITSCFCRSYGCWKVKSTYFIAKNAMMEWESLSQRVYAIVRKLFPALPEEFCVLEDNNREMISHITLLYPILLSEAIYSTLFVLYANKCSSKDEIYRLNLLQAEKLTNLTLIKTLQLQEDLMPIMNTHEFEKAVQLLKQLKEKYSPMAMLSVIENCMQLITKAHHNIFNETNTSLNADTFMPLTVLVLLRTAVPHLGAELALLDDLTDTKNFQFEMNGIRGYCYATLKASYEHIATKLLFE